MDKLPVPIEIFTPDGVSIYLNRACLELNNVKDAGLIVGKYNLLKDPVCMDQLGYREELQRAFRGEEVIIKEFPVPIQDLVNRGIIDKKPFETATMDLSLYPVWEPESQTEASDKALTEDPQVPFPEDRKLFFIVCVFIVRSLYLGRPDIAKAKQYLDEHCHSEYDAHAAAKSANMSVSQLYNIFTKHTGMTPGDYHRRAKVEYIKEKLLDTNLSVKEAFASCGENSRGWILKLFKETTGMTPTEFRTEFRKRNSG